ncbi:hypothetical protein [Enterobacter kobei]|uniref:hypothetical protein n=1 Tax=Enterobacter kobei TaxID=208224 RepID=UPI000A931BAD|nr:hypothetical protein [Enterobacter kobei]
MERRFSVVLETATLSVTQLIDYCRHIKLFIEQVKKWRMLFIGYDEMKTLKDGVM